ncbi:MAG TPA: protein kinase, partial [Gemmatimonadales bacterium]
HAVLADFGVARACCDAEDGVTEVGLAVGTPEYMSPEQASGDAELSAVSDVYSLACVVYEMLAGEPPFRGNTSRAVMAQHVTAAPRPLRAGSTTRRWWRATRRSSWIPLPCPSGEPLDGCTTTRVASTRPASTWRAPSR